MFVVCIDLLIIAVTLIEHLHASLAKLPTESETIILGDFNADFSAEKNVPAYKLKQKLQRFANLNDLGQLIKSPTGICNQSRIFSAFVKPFFSHSFLEMFKFFIRYKSSWDT